MLDYGSLHCTIATKGYILARYTAQSQKILDSGLLHCTIANNARFWPTTLHNRKKY